jgi:hypothetical protein
MFETAISLRLVQLETFHLAVSKNHRSIYCIQNRDKYEPVLETFTGKRRCGRGDDGNWSTLVMIQRV